MRIKDRVAIVTGAGGRIGRGISTRLAEEGARVVVVDVNLETAEETVDLIKKNDGEAVALKVDVTQKAEIQSMADKVLESYGRRLEDSSELNRCHTRPCRRLPMYRACPTTFAARPWRFLTEWIRC